MRNFIRQNKALAGGGAVVAVAALAWVAFGFFGVHTLFTDKEVSQAAPVFDAEPIDSLPADTVPTDTVPADTVPADTVPAESVPSEPITAEPEVEFTGPFQSEDHPTSGTAIVLGNGTEQRFLRFEEFETDNGPDLNVYLFNADRSDFIDLGNLAGNIGDQNYEIPADVDLNVYSQANVWCVRFGVSFGFADLAPAA